MIRRPGPTPDLSGLKMISRRLLESLLGEVPPLDVELDDLDPRLRDAVAGDEVLALIARLREAIRREIARHVAGSFDGLPPPLREAFASNAPLGIGLIDVPEPGPDEVAWEI